MDEEIIFLLLVGVTLWMFFRTRKLSNRLTYMEKYLQETTKAFAQQQTTTTPHDVSVSSGTSTSNLEPEEVQRIMEETKKDIQGMESPDSSGAFVEWLKTDWLMKLGGFLIILGVAWFVNYAIAENWIGEMGRIALGLTFGALVIALGRYRMGRFISQGSILMFVGALIVVFTVWVGYEEYEIFNQISALILMFLTSCTLGFMSIVFSHKPLAYGNIAIGAVAPLLVATSMPNFAGLMLYLLVLSVGAIWVAGLKGWRGLILSSLATVFAYSMTFYETAMHVNYNYSYYGNASRKALAVEYADTGLMFAFIFSALFFAVSVWGMQKIKESKIVDLLTAILTGLYLILWIMVGVSEEWQSLVLVFWTLVFAFGAFTVVRLGGKLAYFFTYTGVGVVFLGVATAVELEGEALTIAYILEATLLILAGYMITRSVQSLWLLALPSVVPLVMAFESMSSSQWAKEGIFSSNAFVLYLIVIATFYLANGFHRELKKTGNEKLALVRNSAFLLGMVYSTITIWMVCMGLFSVELIDSYMRKGFSYGQYDYDGGVMVALFVYTGLALYFYLRSKVTGKKWMHYFGIAYLTLVVGRLLLVEVWGMELLFRFITFFIIGSLLMGVAWFEKSSRNTQITNTNEQNKHE